MGVLTHVDTSDVDPSGPRQSHSHSDREAAARPLSVAVFVFAALLAVSGAVVDEAQEAYVTWSNPKVAGLLLFAAANLAAAGLAAFPGRSVIARAAGALLLVPAVMLMNEHAGSASDLSWLLLGAVAVVLAGGLVAGAVRRPTREA